jgi:hypothetical protein
MRKVVAKRIRLPKGYHFQISDNIKTGGNVYIDLMRKTMVYNKVRNIRIGYVTLSPIESENLCKTHSTLNYEYHDRGLGVLMYARAIQWALAHGYKVWSSGQSSTNAKRVWKSKRLRQYFSVRKIKPDKKMYVQDDTWACYVKPGVNKKKMERL